MTILAQHAVEGKLEGKDTALARWLVYAHTHCDLPLDYRVFVPILEQLKYAMNSNLFNQDDVSSIQLLIKICVCKEGHIVNVLFNYTIVHMIQKKTLTVDIYRNHGLSKSQPSSSVIASNLLKSIVTLLALMKSISFNLKASSGMRPINDTFV